MHVRRPHDSAAPLLTAHQHVPNFIALKVARNIYPDMNLPVRCYHGKDCIKWFFDELDEIRRR